MLSVNRRFDGSYDAFFTRKLEAFRTLAFGALPVQIESADFVVCAEKPFSVEQLIEASNKCCSEKRSLLRCLLAEIRESCHLKSQFEKVLARS